MPIVADFNDSRGEHLFLQDAYYGGRRWRNPRPSSLSTTSLVTWEKALDKDGGDVIVERRGKGYTSYLIPFPGESESTFERRQAMAVYVNVVQPIVDAYCDSVTGKVQRDLGALEPYLKGLDGKRMRWQQLVTEAARWSATHGVMATVVDTPPANPARTRAEEQALGLGIRAILVPPQAWAWLILDDDGKVQEFAYVDQGGQYNPDVLATTTELTVWVWSTTGWSKRRARVPMGAQLASPAMTSVGGQAVPATGLAGHRDVFMAADPLSEGKLPPGVAGEVPVVFSFFRPVAFSATPDGVSIVGDAAHCGRQLYQILSWAEDTLRRAGFSFLQMPSKEQTGKLGEQQQLRLGPEAALGVPAEAGDAHWVTHPSEPTVELRAHAMFLVMLAFRSAGLEVAADQSAQVQSGEALRIRSKDFESRAAAFAQSMAAYEDEVLQLAARYLSQPGATWTVNYPQRFVLPDMQEGLDNAIALMAAFGERLGPEGLKACIQQAVSSAMALSDTELAKVMEEVKTRIEEMIARSKAAPPPPQPGQQPPPGQPGQPPQAAPDAQQPPQAA